MVIRQQQMATFSQARQKTFEERMAGHLNRCFPSECEALGEQGVQDAIRYGIERAASHGIASERDVCKYIDLMFAFGRNFDRNRDLPWASSILKDETLKTATAKMERLYATAKRHATTTVQSPLG
jgi:hypothetical protein